MEGHPPQNGGGAGDAGPPTGGGPPGESSPNDGDGGGERKRRRRRSRPGRSGRRGRSEGGERASETPALGGGELREVPSAPERAAPGTGGVAKPEPRPPKGVRQQPKLVKESVPRPDRQRKAPPKTPKATADIPERPVRRSEAPPRARRRDRRTATEAASASSELTEAAWLRGPERPPERRPATRMQLTAAASQSPGRSFWIAALVFTLVGLLVRLPGLGTGLWADEIFAVMESFRTPFPATLSLFPGDNKHPLYALLAHAAVSIFGETPWSVRLPALLFGVATIPLLYALGTRITSRAEALAAAALLALSYHHVWFSQNARGYAMLAFFAVLTTLLLLRASRADGYRPWIWYGCAAALGAYTHLTFVFTVVAQFLVVGLAALGWPKGERRIGWRGPLVGFALSAALTVALYLPMLSQVLAFFLHKESNLKGISSPTWAVGEAFRVLRVGFGDAFGLGIIVLVIGAIVGLAGAVSYARQSLRTFLLLSLPAVVTVMGAFTARGTMYPRFFFLLIGFALLIGMRGTFATASWLAHRLRLSEAAGNWLGASVAALIVLVSGLSVQLNWRFPKQDFVGAMAYVEHEAAGGDAIAVTDVTAQIYGPFYQKTWPAVRTVADLDAMRRVPRDRAATAAGNVWLIYTFPRYLEKLDAPLSHYVARECTGEKVRTFLGTVGGGEITVCRLERT